MILNKNLQKNYQTKQFTIMKTIIEKREDILNYYIERTMKLERHAHNANTSRRSNLYLKLAISNRKRTNEIANVINESYSESYYNKLHKDIFEEEAITAYTSL